MVPLVAPDRTLTVRTRCKGNAGVQITVSDCGTGIPPQLIDRVFEPFCTTTAHGLSLGLAVCRTIIGAHGGTLSATNNPDRGASFHVMLPFYNTRFRFGSK